MLSVIIPARNSRQLTTECLDSVMFTFNAIEANVEYILIDDDSDADERISDLFLEFRDSVNSEVKIIRFLERQHYTGVFSCGLSQAKGDIILFLSNDMMVTPDFIKTLLSVISLSDNIGIVRGTSQWIDSHPEHECAPPLPVRNYEDVLNFSSYVSKYFGLAYTEDDFLSGDAVLIKRSVVNKIGVMDTRFFGYFGDSDYGLRAQRAGFKLVCAKGAWLHHEGSGHVKYQNLLGKEAVQVTSASVIEMVHTAYSKFREKWQNSLPEIYTDIKDIDFEKLTKSQDINFSEYQEPIVLNLQFCEVL